MTEVAEAAWLSVWVALVATTLAASSAVPLGTMLALARFPGRRAVVVVTNGLMAIPTVLIGLLVYSMFSRRGLLGPLGILYTPWALLVGEVLLVSPLLVAFSRAAIEGLDPRVRETAITLGAGRARLVVTLVREARHVLGAACMSAFGRVVSEIGIALMVGGNIRGETRTLTTAMALATARGEFELAVQLGLVLLGVAMGVIFVAEAVRR